MPVTACVLVLRNPPCQALSTFSVERNLSTGGKITYIPFIEALGLSHIGNPLLRIDPRSY